MNIMLQIKHFVAESKAATVEIAALKTCRTCQQIFPARLENFHSAGHYKGRQQFKATCKDCASDEAKKRYQSSKAANAALKQALALATAQAKSAFNSYSQVRQWHKDGLAPASHKLAKLRDYVEAEKTLRLIQNAMPAEPAVIVHLGEYHKYLELYKQMEGKDYESSRING
jgi:transposase-like protein